MVQKWPGCDLLEYEAGIDPVPSFSDTVLQVMWHSHPQGSKLSEFWIYRSAEPDGSRRYNRIGVVKVVFANAQDTVFIDTEVKTEQRYSYYVTAVSKEDKESVSSDTVWYILDPEAIPLYPPDNYTITDTIITFEWSYSDPIEPGVYILRIEQFYDENYHPLVYADYHDSMYEGHMSVTLAEEWMKSPTYGVPFRWRLDCIGDDELHRGSESDWRFFNIELE
ncbi:MAG: hypothetical protein JXR46_09180 [Calditrichaceae bacterium]|nr:hypothetical protein [Calditrichaceae bacterium]MBN2709205.1 hypothetical protein [Calditrichaceae bacterium]RQV96160.1 MAG: hypothetical protein EH224_05490 [Calditrichota bacterium]